MHVVKFTSPYAEGVRGGSLEPPFLRIKNENLLAMGVVNEAKCVRSGIQEEGGVQSNLLMWIL